MNESVGDHAAWYDEASVTKPGSVILTRWREQRELAKNQVNDSQGTTLQQLTRLISTGGGSGGAAVTEQSAMTVSAVYACVALIAGAIATLPFPVYERTHDGRRRADLDYWWLFNEAPNADMCAAVFWEYCLSSYLLHGDAFAELIRPSFSSNRVIAIRPHHPRRVTPFRDQTTHQLYYRITPQWGGVPYVLDAADMLHVAGLGFDGLRSCSPLLHAARQAISTAITAGEYSSRFFENGARPDFAIKVPGKCLPEQAEVLRTSWLAMHGGVYRSHTPAILSGGMEIEQLTMTHEDSQLLATRSFQIEEIARIFGVPPHLIGQTDKVTSWGSGVENMGRGFVKFTLQRHLIKFEQEINRKLWPVRSRYFFEFNVAGLERGDLKSENEALRIALGRAGEPAWMTPNEVRRIKNMPPIDGADQLMKGNSYESTPNTVSQESGSTDIANQSHRPNREQPR